MPCTSFVLPKKRFGRTWIRRGGRTNLRNQKSNFAEGRHYLGYRGKGGRMILKRILWKYSVNRIRLAQDRGQCWAVTNTVMDLQVPYKAVNLVNSSATISVSKYSYFYQKGLSPVDALVLFSGDTRSRGLRLKSTRRSTIHCGLRPLEQHALLHGIVGL